jgi:hypothetical protein
MKHTNNTNNTVSNITNNTVSNITNDTEMVENANP